VCVGAGEDGIEMLLQIVYQYRKKDPEGADEKECVQNMFQCICTVMMDKENQAR
jgi:beta-catenin-like protein 1